MSNLLGQLNRLVCYEVAKSCKVGSKKWLTRDFKGSNERW